MNAKSRFYHADNFVLNGVRLALLYRFAESAVHGFVFEEASLVNGLTPEEMNGLWMRLFASPSSLAGRHRARLIRAGKERVKTVARPPARGVPPIIRSRSGYGR